MASVFHNYDIRGIYGSEIDESFAKKLGIVFVELYKPKVMVIGHDERIGSESLSSALIDGLGFLHHEHPVKIIDVGLCTTPMVWHAVNTYNADGAIMVTASHNPKEYVGFKLCKKQGVPIGYGSGLEKIEAKMEKVHIGTAVSPPIPGWIKNIKNCERENYKSFANHQLPYIPTQEMLRVVADCTNSAVAPVLVSLFAGTKHELILLNEKPDGNFPAHDPNPLIESTTKELSKKVVELEADFGVIFDGDADRVVFVDEKGERVRRDYITALLGISLISRQEILENNLKNKTKKPKLIHDIKKAKPIVLTDLRSSKVVEEEIVKNGGQLFLTRVGRPHIIEQLRKTGGIVAGELSGHYYFADFHCCDDGVRTLLELMNVLATNQVPLSHVIKDMYRYEISDETNVVVKDVKLVLDAIRQEYDLRKPKNVMKLDGISVYFENFWFNVRGSNTEPLLRITMEADDKKTLNDEFAKLIAVVKKFMP